MNALGRLRERLGHTPDQVAARLNISVPALEAMEVTPFGQLEVSFIAEYVGACGCRLDIVAVHIDGQAIWLEQEPS